MEIAVVEEPTFEVEPSQVVLARPSSPGVYLLLVRPSSFPEVPELLSPSHVQDPEVLAGLVQVRFEGAGVVDLALGCSPSPQSMAGGQEPVAEVAGPV